MFYDRTYYLGRGQGRRRTPIGCCTTRCSKTDRAGSGAGCFTTASTWSRSGRSTSVLALHTMRFADELVDAGDLDIPKPSRAPSKREIEMAGKLVESLHERFDPDAFHDSYRERVLELIETKAAARSPSCPSPRSSEDATDLAAALEASLGASGKAPWLDQAPQVEGKELTCPARCGPGR